MKVGVAVKPGTPVSSVVEWVDQDIVDMVLVNFFIALTQNYIKDEEMFRISICLGKQQFDSV